MAIEFSMRSVTNQANIAYQLGVTGSVTNSEGIRSLASNNIITGTRTGGRSSFNSKVIGTGGSKIQNARAVFLGYFNDTLTGFKQGSYDGGPGIDTLKLPQGTYRVKISGSRVTFTKDGITMTTSGFEKLKAGQTYDFAKLTNRQRIIV